jgi:hypothetical protein
MGAFLQDEERALLCIATDQVEDHIDLLSQAESPCVPATGRELVFETPDHHMMAVNYTAKDDLFMALKPRVLTETRLRDVGNYSNYDLSPEGKRLAAMLADDASGEKGPRTWGFC